MIGSILSKQNDKSKFAQLYIFDMKSRYGICLGH